MTLQKLALWAGLCMLISYTQASLLTGNLDYDITYPSGTYHANDLITFEVWLATASNPLDSIVGFDLTYELTADAVFPNALKPDMSSSWIADGNEMDITITLNAEEKTIRIEGQRQSGHRSGYGEIFRFSLTAANNNLAASDLLVNSGGGIIITIDDGHWRFASQPTAAVQVYPNPTSGRIQLQGASFSNTKCHLYDLQGRWLAELQRTNMDLGELGIPEGMYLLLVITSDNNARWLKLQYRP